MHAKSTSSLRAVNSTRRLWAFASLMILAMIGLGVRLYCVQILWHEKYKDVAENNTQRVFLREPRRGDILDCQGHPLATSFPVKKMFADPKLLGPHFRLVAQTLAPLLSYDEAELAAKLRPTVIRTNAQGTFVTNSYVNLRRKLSDERWQQVTQALGELKFPEESGPLTKAQKAFLRVLRQQAIYAVDDQQRIYPGRTAAAHVIGFAHEVDREFNNTMVTELTGIDGIEAWLNTKLTGVRGWRVTETDRKKREIVVHREQEVEPKPGLHTVLTLDLVIQHIVEQELAEAVKAHTPTSACAIVIRPQTGEILAMATLPNYDPNNPGASPADHRRNRVISDIVEPGSTFKIVVVSAGLNEGKITLEDRFDCENGRWLYMGYVLNDHVPSKVISVEEIITKSSNIGAAKIAVNRLGEQMLYDYIRGFGFGTRTGIPLGGEVSGIIHPVNKWDKLSISRIPMGHSVAVTPLQMAMAMSAVANGGRLMRPMLIKKIIHPNGETFATYEPQVVRDVISPNAAHQMVRALKTVVTKDGTGNKAALEHYTVAGKTGTASKVINGVYAPGHYISSFIGFFPADAPELVIAVTLDDPQGGHYGGSTAAPVFRRIAEQTAQYLKIRPDKEEAEPAVTMTPNAPAGRLAATTSLPDP